MFDARDAVCRAVEAARDEIVELTAELVRIPTVNPPGEHYADCARFLGRRFAAIGLEVEYHAAEGRPEHTEAHPRLNVIGVRPGSGGGPTVHLNGHFDVAPAGGGWSVEPFGGLVREGRVWGRGTCDMKGGLAAAVFAIEALHRAGVALAGTVEVSGTVDEESGGQAGVAWLAEQGRLAKPRVDYAIIPEPLNVDRICTGHRGVWWFEVETRGRIAHGSMPYLGISAIDHLGAVLEAVRTELQPELAKRTTRMPVVPAGSGRATLNVNAVAGGQSGQAVQTPCVADHAVAVFDRRYLVEENYEDVRAEVVALLERVKARVPELDCLLRDRMLVYPTETPAGSPLVAALQRGIREVLGREAAIVASPGSYDQKHFDRIGGVPHCVAYGPGVLELAHQPDEWVAIDDLVASTKVLALATLDLAGGR
jgi:succinyl-diaminopimelate desuccinylase